MHTTKHTTWRNGGSVGPDALLTPPKLLAALGKFDMDPCCPTQMPWPTAKTMVQEPNDGLSALWKGRVWCNPPYSDPFPWVAKMAKHGNGILLVSAKSPEIKWGQQVLATADALLFLKGRILFWTVEGVETKGKWLPNLLAAYGPKNVEALNKIATREFPGILLRRAT